MKSFAKRIGRKIFNTLGYEVSYHPKDALGLDPYTDIKRLTSRITQPVIFDVGANVGQSVEVFKHLMPECIIHAFEPSPTAYKMLEENTKTRRQVFTNNLALGQTCGTQVFLENSDSNMSSFLRPGMHCWGEIINEVPVEISTLDQYCKHNDIEYINLLKTDTQGYDLEVLKGAQSLLKDNRIQLIFVEIIFLDLYEDLPPFDEIFRLVRENSFKLVSLYKVSHHHNLAGWSDALFLNTKFKLAKDT